MTALGAYGELKAELVEVLEALGRLREAGRDDCRALADKLEAERFDLVTVGQFKRGKTCLVNALLGEALLPTGVVPLTSVATVIGYGDRLAMSVEYLDGRHHPVGREALGDYLTEIGNPGNSKGVREVRVAFPASLLRHGVQLLDTPGVGSVHEHNSELALRLLTRADAALFLLSADQPVSRAELDFLAAVREHAPRIFFLLNKIDYLDQDELDQAQNFTRRVLEETLGEPVSLFPVSARLALRGRCQADPKLWERSRLPALLQALEAFLVRDKGKVLLLKAVRSCERMAAQARFELELECRSLAAPPEERAAKLDRFRQRQNALDRQRLELDYRAAVQRLAETVLAPRLRRCRERLEARLRQSLDGFLQGTRELHLRALDDALAEHLAAQLQCGLAACAAELEQPLNEAFADATRLFAAGVELLMEELEQFAADLFHIDRPPSAPDPGRLPEIPFLVDRDQTPAGLELLAEMATTDWPGWLGRRCPRIQAWLTRWADQRIVRRYRRGVADSVDRQCGRLRYHFLERLEWARRRCSEEVLGRYRQRVAGIERSLERSLAEGLADAAALARQDLARRRVSLEDLLGRIAALQDRVESC